MSLRRPKIHIPLLFRNLVLRVLLTSTLAGLLTVVIIDASMLQNNGSAALDPLIWVVGVVIPILIILHHTLR